MKEILTKGAFVIIGLVFGIFILMYGYNMWEIASAYKSPINFFRNVNLILMSIYIMPVVFIGVYILDKIDSYALKNGFKISSDLGTEKETKGRIMLQLLGSSTLCYIMGFGISVFSYMSSIDSLKGAFFFMPTFMLMGLYWMPVLVIFNYVFGKLSGKKELA